MAFWGALVKPNEPYILRHDGVSKRVRITKATLVNTYGNLWNSTSVVRCAVGRNIPICLCVLSTKELSSCRLDLEFEESDNVMFSVSGPRGVHLSGYLLNPSCSCAATTTPDSQNRSSSEIHMTEDMVVADSYDSNCHQLGNIHPVIRSTRNVQLGVVDINIENLEIENNYHLKDICNLPICPGNRKDVDNGVGVANTMEHINEGSEDLGNIPARGFMNKINQSTNEYVSLNKDNRCVIDSTVDEGENGLVADTIGRGNALDSTAVEALDDAGKSNNIASRERVENDKNFLLGSAGSRALMGNPLAKTDERGIVLSVSLKKKKQKVNSREGTPGLMKAPPVHASKLTPELTNQQVNGLSISKRKKKKDVKGGECNPGMKATNPPNLVTSRITEQVNELSNLHREKKKKARSGEFITHREKALNPPQVHGLKAHKELPNEQVSELHLKKKKKKKARSREIPRREKALNLSQIDGVKLHRELPNEQISELSLHREKKKKTRNREVTIREKTMDPGQVHGLKSCQELPNELVSGLSVSHRKKKEVKSGEGISGEVAFIPSDHALKSNPELPTELVNDISVAERKKKRKIRDRKRIHGEKAPFPPVHALHLHLEFSNE